MRKMMISPLSFLLCLVLLFGLAPSAWAANTPSITAPSALLMDMEHDSVLYEKNATGRRYPASITKIMTALVVLEAIEKGELQADTMLTCSAAALADITWDSSTQNIAEGEQMSVEDLLYCLMCASANEAANILAEGVSGSIPAFVDRMNQRAAMLGMNDSHFMNPHGLHDNNHYSTAYDIYTMTVEAMRYPLFQKIVATASHTVPATNMSEERRFHNTNALLSSYRYAGYTYSPTTGVKTGSTAEAGYCLVSSAQEGSRTLIAIVLGAESVTEEDGSIDRKQFSESKALLSWGFSNFKERTLAGPGTLMKEIAVTQGKNVSYVLGGPASTVTALLPADYDLNLVETEISLLASSVPAPVSQGQVLGSIVVSYDGTVYGKCDLVAINDVERSMGKYILHLISSFFGNWVVRILLVILVIYLVYRYIKTANRAPRRGNRLPPNTTPYPGPDQRNKLNQPNKRP